MRIITNKNPEDSLLPINGIRPSPPLYASLTSLFTYNPLLASPLWKQKVSIVCCNCNRYKSGTACDTIYAVWIVCFIFFWLNSNSGQLKCICALHKRFLKNTAYLPRRELCSLSLAMQLMILNTHHLHWQLKISNLSFRQLLKKVDEEFDAPD